MTIHGLITPIGGLALYLMMGCFAQPTTVRMTIGRKTLRGGKDRIGSRILDQRTRAVLHAISTEPKGKALVAYVRTILTTKEV